MLSKGHVQNIAQYIVPTQQFSIKDYVDTLKFNRLTISSIAEKITTESIKRSVLVWGAGRIFDCLCKQTSWSPRNFFLYDKFIRNILPEISGYKIIDEDQLMKLAKDTLVIVASRNYFDEISAEARKLGFYDIKPFGGF